MCRTLLGLIKIYSATCLLMTLDTNTSNWWQNTWMPKSEMLVELGIVGKRVRKNISGTKRLHSKV